MMIKIKNIKRLAEILFFVLLISSSNLLTAGQVTKAGTSSAAFLKIPVGARAISMGGAFVAVADDPSALFWNPGGIPQIQNYSVIIDHAQWLPGINYNFFGALLPLQNYGTVGISISALSMDEVEITTPQDQMGTGDKYDASSTAIALTYGRFLTDRFSIGATFKFINERIWHSSANAIAFDVGTIFKMPFPGLRFGFSITNWGTKMQMTGEDLNVSVDIDPTIYGDNQSVVGQFKTGKFDTPLLMQVGLAWDAYNKNGSRLTLAVDGLNPNDNSQSLNLGAECAFFKQQVILNAGYSEIFLNKAEKGLTLGAGINTKILNSFSLRMGYAYQDFKHFTRINRFTLVLAF